MRISVYASMKWVVGCAVIVSALAATMVPAPANAGGVYYPKYWTFRASFLSFTPFEEYKIESLSDPSLSFNTDQQEFTTAFGFSLDASYFLTDRIAVEASLGYVAADFKAGTVDPTTRITTYTDSRNMAVFPLDINLQYHIAPYGKLAPYIGAGVGYAYYGLDFTGAFSTNVQFGVDYWLKDTLSLSFDAKKYFGMENELERSFFDSANRAYPMKETVTWDPLIISVGIGTRF